MELSEFNKAVVLLFLHDQWALEPTGFALEPNELYKLFMREHSDELRVSKKVTPDLFYQTIATIIDVKVHSLVKRNEVTLLQQWLDNAAKKPIDGSPNSIDIFYIVSRNVLLASRREHNAELLRNVFERIKTSRPDLLDQSLNELMPSLSKRYLKSVGIINESYKGNINQDQIKKWLAQCPLELQAFYTQTIHEHWGFLHSKSSHYYWLLEHPTPEQALDVAKHPDIAHRILDWTVLDQAYPALKTMLSVLDAEHMSGKDYSVLWTHTLLPALTQNITPLPMGDLDV